MGTRGYWCWPVAKRVYIGLARSKAPVVHKETCAQGSTGQSTVLSIAFFIAALAKTHPVVLCIHHLLRDLPRISTARHSSDTRVAIDGTIHAADCYAVGLLRLSVSSCFPATKLLVTLSRTNR